LTDGTVLRQTFQFWDADGALDGRYLEIGSADEWNEKMALYGTLGANVEFTGDIDFTGLTSSDDVVLNTTVNNVRSAQKEDGSYYTVKNLTIPELSNAYYGLIRTLNGSLSNVNFSDIDIEWKNNNRAPDSSGIIGRVYGTITECTFTRITLKGGGNYFGCIGRCDGGASDITLIDIDVESVGQRVGGLAGELDGDLMRVEAYSSETGNYYVSGSYYVGGIVGYMLTSDHEQTGHEYIGGTDYVTGSALISERTPVTGSDKWFYTDLEQPGNIYDDPTYKHDSLSYNYAIVEDIWVDSLTVCAQRHSAGGILGRSNANVTNVNGYGYLLADNLNVGYRKITASDGTVTSEKKGEVYVQANLLQAETSACAGGAIGIHDRSAMLHAISVYGVNVDGNGGSSVGGAIGSVSGASSEDYSAYKNDEQAEHVSGFVCGVSQITVENTVVSGSSNVGGAFGYLYRSNTNGVTVTDTTAFGNGNCVGGAIGQTAYLSYTTDTDVSDVRVYNAGDEAKYTGGVVGQYYYGYMARIKVHDTLVIARGTNSSYTGGVFGWSTATIKASDDFSYENEETWTNIVYNTSVYGTNYVGGVGGYCSTTYGLIVNPDSDEGQKITVSGQGDYIGGLFGNGGTQYYLHAQNLTVTGRGIMTGGIYGYMNGHLLDSDVSAIKVSANGDGGYTETYLFSQSSTELTKYVRGTLVGGIAGYAPYVRHIRSSQIKDIEVSATTNATADISGGYGNAGSMVGGLVGGGIDVYIYWTNVDDIKIDTAGSKNIGGLVGLLWYDLLFDLSQ
jgi:hypothetical protein